MKIKKGDNVLILKGKDRKKIGKVIKTFIDKNRIIVEGVNLMTKNFKPRKQGQKGERILIAKPINISNVKLVCPKCKAATRISYTIIKGEKFRTCKKCKKTI